MNAMNNWLIANCWLLITALSVLPTSCTGTVLVDTFLGGDNFKFISVNSDGAAIIGTKDSLIRINSTTLEILDEEKIDDSPVAELLLTGNVSNEETGSSSEIIRVIVTCNDTVCKLRNFNNASIIYSKYTHDNVRNIDKDNVKLSWYKNTLFAKSDVKHEKNFVKKTVPAILQLENSNNHTGTLKFCDGEKMTITKIVPFPSYILVFSVWAMAGNAFVSRVGFVNPEYRNEKLEVSWYHSYFDMELRCGTSTVLKDVSVIQGPSGTLIVTLFSSVVSTETDVCVFELAKVEESLVLNIKTMCHHTSQGVTRICEEKSNKCQYNNTQNLVQSPPTPGGHLRNFHGNVSLEQQPNITVPDFNSVGMTTETINNWSIAYIWADDGTVYQMGVYPKPSKPYAMWTECAISSSSQILSIHLTKDHHMLVLSKNKVARIPSNSCKSHTTCGTCTSGADNLLCGWCLQTGRCTVASECTSRFYQAQCPAIVKIQPDVIAAANTDLNITLTLSSDNMTPPVFCGIRVPLNGTSAIFKQATIVSQTDINCYFPNTWNISRANPGGKVAHVIISLATTPSGITILERRVPYIVCHSYVHCSLCLNEANQGYCMWCWFRKTCISSQLRCERTNELVIQNASECPMIIDVLPASNMSSVYISSNSPTNVTNVYLHGKSLPKSNITFNYTCGLKDTTPQPAEFLEAASVLNCFLSPIPGSTLRTSLQVFYGGTEVENNMSKGIEIYSCSDLVSKDNLCQCASFSHYHPYYMCHICGNQCLDKTACNATSIICPLPRINKVSPLSSHFNSSVMVTISGTNLGSHFNDTRDVVTIAGVPCKGVEEGYLPAQRIVCQLPPANNVTKGHIEVKLQGQEAVVYPVPFSFKDPVISNIQPSFGPKSGGTMVTVTGTDLDTGNERKVFIGRQECKIVEQLDRIICQTSSMQDKKEEEVLVQFDGFSDEVSGHKVIFTYHPDPKIISIDPQTSFESGGRQLQIKVTGLNFIQRPQIFVWFQNGSRSSPLDCSKNQTNFTCPSPARNRKDNTLEDCARLGFIMDNATSVLRPPNTKLLYYPDPVINPLLDGRIMYKKVIEIKGTNLHQGASKVDVQVILGGSHKCQLLTFENDRLAFSPPSKAPQDGVYRFNITVHIGFFRQSVGYLEYELDLSVLWYVLGGIAAFVAIAVLVVAGKCITKRTRRRLKNHRKKLEQKMDIMESTLKAQCRKEFAALQTAVSDLTGDLEGVRSLYRDYPIYMEALVSHEEQNNKTSQSYMASASTPNFSDDAVDQFSQLLREEKFLIAFACILEKQYSITMRDRSSIATKLFLANHDNVGYITGVLKTLLKDLVDRNIATNTTRLLLRRSDSICEKLLTHWLSVCMYHELKESSGSALYILYKAIKIQVEKGPLDYITHCAKYSLSETHLFIDSDVGYQQIMLNVTLETEDGSDTQLQVSVLDCDTISQVKAKILEQFYKNVPFSSRAAVENTSLELQSSTGSFLELSDEDSTSDKDGSLKRINTVKHYNLKSGMNFNLNIQTPTTSHRLEMNVLGKSEKATNALAESSLTLWHLTRPHRSVANEDIVRLSSDIFLPRMLATKGTLQRYIDDLFNEIFVVTERVPVTIKYLLDLLDILADRSNITDPDVIHSWKCNSLMLRFWVNVIKNPEFVFDIHKPVIVDSCLSVVAQTLMDSCSTDDLVLGPHSPSNKLLFARDIPRYRDMVTKFFTDIKNKPSVTDEDLNIFLTDQVSGMFCDSQYTKSHKQGLMAYAMKYKDVIINEFTQMESFDTDFVQYRERFRNIWVSDYPEKTHQNM